MADRSPAFNPPVNSVPENGKDALLIKVDETQTEWANRKSQQVSFDNSDLTIKHVGNGR